MNPNLGYSGDASNLDVKTKQATDALAQKQYGDAIILLEPLVDQAPPASTQAAKLRRHLAKAYMGHGDVASALDQCQQLLKHPETGVQKWAKDAIAHLKKRYPHVEITAPAPAPLSPSSNATPDATGFKPLNPPSTSSALPSHTSPTLSGFNAQNRAQQIDTPSPSSGFSREETMGSAGANPSYRAESSEPKSSEPESMGYAGANPSYVAPQTPVSVETLPWKHADRAKRWSPIKVRSSLATRINTVLVHGWTAIALWSTATLFLNVGMAIGNPIRRWLEGFVAFPRWFFLEHYSGRVAGLVLAGLVLLSPWILDGLLRWVHNAKPLSLDELAQYSAETKTVLQKACRKSNHPVPTLKRLATQTPVLMSYGLSPRFSRIVVSEGVLSQLKDDELAALYAAEVSRIQHWDLALITLVTLSAQISYGFYQLLANWGDGRKVVFLNWIGAVFAAIAYGMFWLVRWTGLWLTRFCVITGDRAAVELTGNPNGLARALLKLAIATATTIRHQGKTPPILEQFEGLMAIGYRSALTIGSVFPYQWQAHHQTHSEPPTTAPTEATPTPASTGATMASTILAWDYRNPHRDWLAINNSHPPLGDRLHRLSQYAKKWQLEPEIDLASPSRITALPAIKLQVAPFIGLLVGAAVTLVLWSVGAIANQFNWRAIEWFEYDSQAIFQGMLALGFSFGTIFRFNYFFPELKPSQQPEPLANLLVSPDTLPVDSQPVQLKGKLLGRSGVGNWLNQDLILQTQTGLIRLHCISSLGSVGNLVFDTIRLQRFKGRTVTVRGWLRRGATPWVDVHTIQAQRGRPVQSGHPIWSMILSGSLALWGAYMLY